MTNENKLARIEAEIAYVISRFPQIEKLYEGDPVRIAHHKGYAMSHALHSITAVVENTSMWGEDSKLDYDSVVSDLFVLS